VNLLDDHLVDVLLDAAAMGVNTIEREGVSFTHPARFILIGTMNPEEGELRPQLLDRFGLCVDVEGIRDPDQRVLIAERDAAFKRGDHEFMNEFAGADHNLSRALAEAIAAVDDVEVTKAQTRLISSICVEADVLGHRADVVIDRAVRALGAYRRHHSPTREDVYDAATLALAHRARKPLRREEDESTSPERSDDQEGSKPSESEASEPQPSDSQAQAESAADESSSASDSGEQSAGSDRGMTTGGSSGNESSPEATEMFNLRRIDLPRQRRVRKQGGKRAASQTPDRRGRYVRAEPKAKVNDLAIDATVRAAAPMQKDRGRREKLSVGGTTPLTHGLMAGYKVVKTELLRDQTIRPLLVLISDGRGNISMFKEEPLVEAQKVAGLIEAEQIDCLVIDSARDYSHLPSVQHLARVAPRYQTYAFTACAD